jgi:hypothetical protein
MAEEIKNNQKLFACNICKKVHAKKEAAELCEKSHLPHIPNAC